MRTRLWGLSLLFGGCFETEPAVEPDPVEVCRECTAMRCAQYHDPCVGDAACNECFGAAKNLECLANTLFHPAANCACEECASECGHICPGGEGACNACTVTACQAQGEACLGDPACAPCLEDPFQAGCAENPNYITADACGCENCGQECIWVCPQTGNDCAVCISSMCSEPFGACLQDELCAACFESAIGPGCAENPELMALQSCLCASCNDLCGVLFACA